jgi:ADP-heptose:LPS heptosyltransferase
MLSSILYNLKRSILNLYCLLSDLIFVFFKAKSTPGKKKILIIKTDNIGDFILWTDSGKEYQTIYPPENYELTLLGNSTWTSLAKESNYFSNIISLDRKKFILHPFYRAKKMKEIISCKWHKVIYHSFSHEFSTGLSILKLITAEQIIAAPSDNGIDHEFWRSLVHKKITSTPAIEKTVIHELKRNAAFLRSLGHSNFVDSIPDLNGLCASLKIELPHSYYVIFPGASSPTRKWNEANFIDLCNYIHKKTGWTGVICGAKSEITIADNILKKATVPLLSLTGKTNLQEFLWVLKYSNLVITNETSCTHMAASVNAKTICILGGGHFGRFLPYPAYQNRQIPQSIYYQMDCFYCNWNCKYRPTKFQAAPCIENISLKLVINTVNVMLEEQ